MNTQLINQAAANISRAEPEAATATLNQQAVEFVNDLFKSLQVAYPAWKQAFPTERELALAKKSWIRAFAENGITSKEQVALGMTRARRDQRDFFPGVGKFIGWCQPTPEDFGLPDEDRAWREACQHSHHAQLHRWSHPGVFEAGCRTTWFDIRSSDTQKGIETTRRRFADHYADIIKELAQGVVFKQPTACGTALEQHTNGRKVITTQNKEKGQAAIAQMRASLGMDSPEQSTWARS